MCIVSFMTLTPMAQYDATEVWQVKNGAIMIKCLPPGSLKSDQNRPISEYILSKPMALEKVSV